MRKWNWCEPIIFQNFLCEHDCITIQHMEKKKVMDVVKNKIIVPFQIGDMSYPSLNKNKASKD